MLQRHGALLESMDDFRQLCPRCANPLSDRTAVDQDCGMLFYRVRFECPACGWWLCTRLENFAQVGPVPSEGEPLPDYLSPTDLRIRLDLTQMVVRQFMPHGVDSYEAGRVWLSGEKTVTKTWSQFKAGGLHLCLAILAQGYFEKGDAKLGKRALELAVQALRSADKADSALSDSNRENHRNAARILAHLAYVYRLEGRLEDEQALLTEARGWAPELFESTKRRR